MISPVSSPIIENAFRFLAERFNFVVESRTDDAVAGSVVTFAHDRVRVAVEYDSRSGQSDVMFALDGADGRARYRATLHVVLVMEGGVSEARGEVGGARERLQLYANLCERYALRAIQGDEAYYEELRVLNDRMSQE